MGRALLQWPGCSGIVPSPSSLRPLPRPWGKPNPPTPGGQSWRGSAEPRSGVCLTSASSSSDPNARPSKRARYEARKHPSAPSPSDSG